jgi:hypothetical protein
MQQSVGVVAVEKEVEAEVRVGLEEISKFSD